MVPGPPVGARAIVAPPPFETAPDTAKVGKAAIAKFTEETFAPLIPTVWLAGVKP